MSSASNNQHSLSLRHAVAVTLALSALSMQCTQLAQAADSEEVATLSDVNVVDDPLRAFANEPSASSFGFAKPLLETPRTVQFVSEEQLRLFGVSTVEDLSRLVPGTYTTTRYGLQGGISVRGVSADFYYRGMKRLQMQGHVRTVLSAYDNIEVIKGPPSPLFGLGKIGGYANLEPKSGRARTGKYMTKESGYFQQTVGSYDKNEAQFGLGVPFRVKDRAASVYFVGLLEDSDSYVRSVPAKQKFLQATTSIDNAVGQFRLETGGQIQRSVTSGAYFTRNTQDLMENGTYITGRPLVNLDVNGDGRIGYVETFLGSPVSSLSGSNQPLDQRFAVTVTSKNDIASFKNTINGIPSTMKSYLAAHPEISCSMADYMRSSAVASISGSQVANGSPVTRTLPAGFVLNPCNTGTVTLSDGQYRSNGAYEREQNALQRMFYADLIYDTDPNFTLKNQIFYDSLSSFKDSWLPYGENQAIRTFEDKVTVTKMLPTTVLPSWLTVNTLGSVNWRRTAGFIRSSGGDFDYRQDITYNSDATTYGSGTGGFYPNTMFWTQLSNDSYQTGAPNSRHTISEYTETGVGGMLDITIARDTNLLLGLRYDKVSAEAQDKATMSQTSGNLVGDTTAMAQAYAAGQICQTPGAFVNVSTVAGVLSGTCPGTYLSPGVVYSSSEGGRSFSTSLSHQLPWGDMRPYLTYAKTKIILDAANNLFTGTQARDSLLIGDASIKELGIKGTMLRNKIQWTLAAFQQQRTDVSGGSDPTVDAFATSTDTKGIEAGVNYQINKKWYMGASLTSMQARYVTGASALVIDVTARDLGFSDIVDLNGNVYPAEAFGYGGRLRILLTDPNNVYDEVPGAPEVQAALNTTYNLTKSITLLANAQYTGESWANRIQTVTIPASTTYNVGMTWDKGRIHLKGNIYNLTDELTFRAGNGGVSSMVSVLPTRRYEAQLKLDF